MRTTVYRGRVCFVEVLGKGYSSDHRPPKICVIEVLAQHSTSYRGVFSIECYEGFEGILKISKLLNINWVKIFISRNFTSEFLF